MNFLGEVKELEIPAAILDGGKGGDQLADSGAVDVIHVGKVYDDLGAAVVEQFTNGLAQQRAALAEGDSSPDIDDCDHAGIPICGSQIHLLA